METLLLSNSSCNIVPVGDLRSKEAFCSGTARRPFLVCFRRDIDRDKNCAWLFWPSTFSADLCWLLLLIQPDEPNPADVALHHKIAIPEITLRDWIHFPCSSQIFLFTNAHIIRSNWRLSSHHVKIGGTKRFVNGGLSPMEMTNYCISYLVRTEEQSTHSLCNVHGCMMIWFRYQFLVSVTIVFVSSRLSFIYHSFSRTSISFSCWSCHFQCLCYQQYANCYWQKNLYEKNEQSSARRRGRASKQRPRIKDLEIVGLRRKKRLGSGLAEGQRWQIVTSFFSPDQISNH